MVDTKEIKRIFLLGPMRSISAAICSCVLLSCGMMVGCAQRLQPAQSTQASYYKESLKPFLPKLQNKSSTPTKQRASKPMPASLYQRLDKLLKQETEKQKTEGFISGYSIQLYAGLSRNEASRYLNKARRHTSLHTTMKYRQPRYVVWVGFFESPLAAQAHLYALRKLSPSVLVLKRKLFVTELLNRRSSTER